MAKLKLDMTKVKEFLFLKGERVALVVFGIGSVALMALGIRTGMQAGGPPGYSSWGAGIASEADKLRSRLVALQPPEEAKKPLEEGPGDVRWEPRETHFVASSLNQLADQVDTKRRNPPLLPPLAGARDFQLDYVRAPILSLDLQVPSQKVLAIPDKFGTTPKDLAKVLRPKRMVVVNGIYPYREQVEIYRQALRLNTLQEVLTRDPPKFLGLLVTRYEIGKDGKVVDTTPLYQFNAKTGKYTVKPETDLTLRESFFDEENLTNFAGLLAPGLATPLPKLTHGKYPRLELEPFKAANPVVADAGAAKPAIKIDLGVETPMPKMEGPMGGGAGPEPVTSYFLWKFFTKDMVRRWAGDYFPFHPLGLPPEAGLVKPTTTTTPGAEMPAMAKENEPAPGTGVVVAPPPEIPNLILRFVDTGVDVGKTYRYSIQVRAMNPNYNKKNDVAFQALAEVKEILSPAVFTPTVTIPGEFLFYATDMNPKELVSTVAAGKPEGNWYKPVKSDDGAVMQIHRWIGKSVDPDNTERRIGDWAIAERILVRRGSWIGRPDFRGEVPVWHMGKIGFDLPSAVGKGGKITDKERTGIPLDMTGTDGTTPGHLLVDLDGGRKVNVLVGKANLTDESAAELLILTPEGKLILRNSRIDTEEDYPEGKERKARHDQWRERVEQLRKSGPSNQKLVAPPTSS